MQYQWNKVREIYSELSKLLFDILTSHRIIKGVTIINILKIRSHYLLETFPNPLSAPANQQHSKYYYHNIYTILVIFKI